MDRCAIFIDAGHLLAEGGALCCNTKKRARISCNYAALISAISSRVAAHSGLQVLRTYWYDGARDEIPTSDHIEIGRLPNVKLRLGRLSGNKQKGVDALILLDLMVLAQERAMVTAYLLGGDEDLRQGMAVAQQKGVRVILVGIPPKDADARNQADTLIREADEHILLDKGLLAPFFSELETPEVKPASGKGTPSLPADNLAKSDCRELAAKAGSQFAANWIAHATAEEIANLRQQHPRIPLEMDAQLLRDAEASMGSMRGRDELRRELRSAFWKVISRGEKSPRVTARAIPPSK